MAEKTDRRIRKTRAQLRKGLAELMQEKSVSEITVGAMDMPMPRVAFGIISISPQNAYGIKITENLIIP